jgi:hypothetical protein
MEVLAGIGVGVAEIDGLTGNAWECGRIGEQRERIPAPPSADS